MNPVSSLELSALNLYKRELADLDFYIKNITDKDRKQILTTVRTYFSEKIKDIESRI